MKRKNRTYRQGDVLIVELDKKDKLVAAIGKDVRENGKVILAHGEVTGHAHIVEGNADLEFNEVIGDDQLAARILSVSGREAQLVHDEHATIMIPPGRYKIVRQREYSPKEIRRVAD